MCACDFFSFTIIRFSPFFEEILILSLAIFCSEFSDETINSPISHLLLMNQMILRQNVQNCLIYPPSNIVSTKRTWHKLVYPAMFWPSSLLRWSRRPAFHQLGSHLIERSRSHHLIQKVEQVPMKFCYSVIASVTAVRNMDLR